MKHSNRITGLLLVAIAWLGLTSCTQDSIATKPLASSPASTPVASIAQPSSEAQPGTPTEKPEQVLVSDKFASSGLDNVQRASLKELGIPIVIPTYVPDSFKVSKVVANLCKLGAPQRGNCREGSNYTILYRNAENTCLLVNAAGGGVGGGAGEFEFQTPTALLGDVIILFGQPSGANQAPTSEQLGRIHPNLASFPATLKSVSGRSPLYNVVVGDSAYYQDTYKCGKNTSVTPLEFEKIVQSLKLL